MKEESPIDAPQPDPIRDFVLAAQSRALELKRQAQAATKAVGILASLQDARDKQHWFRIRALMEAESSYFQQLREEGQIIVEALESLYRQACGQTKELLMALPRHIEMLAVREGLALDRMSQHPKYTFKDGFIRLEVDETRRVARISNYEARPSEVPLDIEAIGAVLKSEEARLFTRKFEGAKLLQKIRSSYLAILRRESRPDGSPVPIRSIARRLASNDPQFRRDEFLIDLSNLVNKGPAEVSGFRFDLQQTSDTSQGMLLYGPAGKGMINLLIFSRITS
jgi:hypothetical protein